MAKVLLINPSYEPSYGGTKVGIINPVHPTLGLATIAATARQRGHTVEVLDLCWRPYEFELVRERVLAFKPDIVGITATTPLMNQLRDISVLIKDISKDIQVVGGGPHVSALPAESIRESMLDAVFVGEADYSFANYCDAGKPADVKGLYYRSGDDVISTGPQTLGN
ncbi:MAG: cobalamin B12-binding domain-containing protein, partial [Rhodospirillales bacterium]|nr:cobalamin B12-binding domain-containing protein [Rhodospirillales bacterium]